MCVTTTTDRTCCCSRPVLSTAQDLRSVSSSSLSVITSSDSSATDLVSSSLRLGRLDLDWPD